MRPNKYWNEVYKAIEYRLKTGSNKKFTPYLIKRMEREWDAQAAYEFDYRSGEDTYGYKDNDSIENRLMYISDRFNCAFRLRWLLDGIEKGYI